LTSRPIAAILIQIAAIVFSGGHMNTAAQPQNAPSTDTSQAVRRRMIQIGFLVITQSAVLFLSAGTLRWIEAWVYILLYIAFIALNAILILPKGTGLMEERSKIGAGAKSWDLRLAVWITILGAAILLVAGLDQRFSWSQPYETWLQWLAAALILPAYILFASAMAANRFFSSVVRIQVERGHTVIDTGPYRFIRHPGYAGNGLSSIGTCLLLASWWSLIPAFLLIVVLTWRTALEDRTLQAELPGYVGYARRVRYRLLPGVW
jgi:protein-S-isoprenylcysteine O-methyltransferase Ste14